MTALAHPIGEASRPNGGGGQVSLINVRAWMDVDFPPSEEADEVFDYAVDRDVDPPWLLERLKDVKAGTWTLDGIKRAMPRHVRRRENSAPRPAGAELAPVGPATPSARAEAAIILEDVAESEHLVAEIEGVPSHLKEAAQALMMANRIPAARIIARRRRDRSEPLEAVIAAVEAELAVIVSPAPVELALPATADNEIRLLVLARKNGAKAVEAALAAAGVVASKINFASVRHAEILLALSEDEPLAADDAAYLRAFDGCEQHIGDLVALRQRSLALVRAIQLAQQQGSSMPQESGVQTALREAGFSEGEIAAISAVDAAALVGDPQPVPPAAPTEPLDGFAEAAAEARQPTRSTTDIDYGALIGEVALRLLAEPAEKRHKEWRYGAHGSLSIDLAGGCYFDHEAGKGGGTLDLIVRQIGGGDRASAVQWLKDQGLISTPGEARRRYSNGGTASEPIGKAGTARGEAKSAAGEATASGQAKPDRMVVTYDYVDESGVRLFQVCRFEPKTFRQRRPDGAGWSWSVKDVRQVPYRLPALLAAIVAKRPVLVVEGEKDADALAAIGVVATCNAGGANKWRDEHTKHCRAADVVLVPDNDDAGRSHVNDIGAKLQGVAACIRVLTLPDVPPKGDICDWLASGGTAEALHDLIDQAPVWEPMAGGDKTEPQPGTDDDKKAWPFGGAASGKVAWPDKNEHGTPRKTYKNARFAIETLGVRCSYDEFHDRKIVDSRILGKWAGELSDDSCAILRQAIIDRFAFDPGKANVNDAVTELCLEHRFDPIVEYLKGLQWDGVERLQKWLPSYLSAEDSKLNRTIGSLALVAAVRRVRHPGCKFDQIVVLEGFEGTNKSTAIAVMAGAENFSDQTILSVRDKEQQELVKGIWLYEIADLAGMKNADVEKIKAFASRTSDRARPAYGRHRVDVPRRCVFFATTNDDTYLKSQTGNRRFWPVKTGFIDIDALRGDRDQLWAEAAQLEATGGSLELPQELWGDAGAEQEKRRQPDPWDDILADVKGALFPAEGGGEEERISTAELLVTHLKLSPGAADSWGDKKLGQAMRRLGWIGPRKLRIGKPVRGYSRPLFHVPGADGADGSNGHSERDG